MSRSPALAGCFVAIACLVVFLAEATYRAPKKAGVFLPEFICKLDPRINKDTLAGYKNGTYLKQIDRYLWETACGRSRGVFTLINDDAYKGHTYSCSNWPDQWGIKNMPGDWFSDESLYEKHLEYLDMYIQGNFNTTAVHGPGTCDFKGFSIGYCGEERELPYRNTPWAERLGGKPFRGVNTGGLFVLEPWITPNFTNWSLALADEWRYGEENPEGSPGYEALVKHWNTWYTNDDFAQMKSVGLNAIRVPVGWWYWADAVGLDRTPYNVPKQDINDKDHPIVKIIQLAKDNDLVVMLDLHGAPGSQNGLDNSGLRSDDPQPARWGYTWFYDREMQDQTTTIIVAMAKWIDTIASEHGLDNIVALELLNEPWVFGDMSIVRDFYFRSIDAIRQVSEIPLIIHDAFRHTEWDWLLMDFPYENVFMDTHIYHAFNADDVASSTPKCDRNKMIVAQNIACGYGSMMRFKTCLSLPVVMGEWSLAIDDCIGIIRGAEDSVQLLDFGQCKNLKERVGDPWWTIAYRKLALKQMAIAERELGWFFWTWKTEAVGDPSRAYWDFTEAIRAEIIPVPLGDNEEWITEACYEFESTEPYTC